MAHVGGGGSEIVGVPGLQRVQGLMSLTMHGLDVVKIESEQGREARMDYITVKSDDEPIDNTICICTLTGHTIHCVHGPACKKTWEIKKGR